MLIVLIRDFASAEKYVRGELSVGTTLARKIVKSIDFASGKFRVFTPDGFDINNLVDFRYQTFHLEGDEPIALARAAKHFLRVEGHAILIQDTQASISDPWLESCEHRNLVRTYDSEIYWTLVGQEFGDASEKEMMRILNCASFWPFSAFFCASGVERDKPQIDDSDLDCAVESLVGIAVGAFDERSFLVWWRDDIMPFPE